MNPQPNIRLQRPLPVLILIVLLFLAVLLPDRVWNILLVGFGGMVVIAYSWVRILGSGIWGSRQLRFGWVAVGDRLSEQFEIHNDSGISALWVEVVDHSNVPGYQPNVVRSLAHHQVIRWRESTICQQRGHFQLGPWELSCGDLFGLFKVTIHYPETEEIIIHPPVDSRLPFPLPTGQGSGLVRAQEMAWQATINAAGVRGYQPSDPRQWIHWPTTAHRDSLYVRQFDLDATGPVWVLLDFQESVQLGLGARGTEEQGILAAAAFVAQGLAQNRRVGLAAYAREPHIIPPARGKNQQWKILRALALVAADGDNDLSVGLADINRIARRGSAVVIVTPSGSASWLGNLFDLSRRGVSCTIILLDRGTFGDQSGQDGVSEGLRISLRQYGFQSHVIREGQISRTLDIEHRRGFWEFKVTGTGKVVIVKDPFGR